MTSNDAGPRTTTRVPLSATALGLDAIYAAVFWVLVVLAFHWIRPDLEPCCAYVSNYGRGDYEWLMQAAFVVFGFGWMAAGIALRRAVRDARGAILMSVLPTITGAGLLIAGMWRADDMGTAGDPSPEDVFHSIGSTIAFGGVIVFGLAAAVVLRGTRLARHAIPHLVLALVTLALLITFNVWADATGDGFGWPQRVLVMAVVPGWLAWLGWRLAAAGRTTTARRA